MKETIFKLKNTITYDLFVDLVSVATIHQSHIIVSLFQGHRPYPLDYEQIMSQHYITIAKEALVIADTSTDANKAFYLQNIELNQELFDAA